MEALAFILIVVVLIATGVIASVRLYEPGALGTGHFRRIRRLRTLRATPGPEGSSPAETVIEEIIDEEEPEAQEA
jgi:hypothetical protein